MLALIFHPWARIAGAISGVLVIWFAFASHYEQRGASKAVAKIEKATTNAISKAKRAGERSATGGGMRELPYRD